MISWRIASSNPPNHRPLLSQSVRDPEIQASLCLWWWETHTDEAAGVSRRSWVLSAKRECWVGGLWRAHSLKSTCCALSGRNRPPETRDPYTKTQWPGCPHRASVRGTCCRRMSDRGHHEWFALRDCLSFHRTWGERVYGSLYFSANEDLTYSYSAQLKRTNSQYLDICLLIKTA